MANKGMNTTADWLEMGEYRRLLQCLRDDKEYLWETYATLAFCTGCRISDVLTFKWKDVLAENNAVKEKKTGKTRKITFSESTQRRIADLYGLLGCPDREWQVFRSTQHKKNDPYSLAPYTRQYVNQVFKEFKRRYGIKIGNFSSHTFRKTFGRYVYDSMGRTEESLTLLNKIFKHSSIVVTKTYIGITDDEVKGVYESIEF